MKYVVKITTSNNMISWAQRGTGVATAYRDKASSYSLLEGTSLLGAWRRLNNVSCAELEPAFDSIGECVDKLMKI